jgi:histidinol phosphatase-like PHP family hydrolase
MEDMHIHLKDGIKSQEIFNQYINKCIEMKLKRVVFLDHGNRISSKHIAVLSSKEIIDLFINIIDNFNQSNKAIDLKVIKGIEIDYSTDVDFRKETAKLLSYGNFEWVVGAIHSMKFDTLGGYLEAVIDMLNNYKINAIAHLKLDDTYKEYEQLLIDILEICLKRNVYIEINTSDRSRWNDDQLNYMLGLINKYKVGYVFSSDAHQIDEIGYQIEDTMEKVKKWGTKQ